MKKIITNNKIMLIISIFLFFYGILHSLYAKDFQWFQRSGAFIVLIGLILSTRPTILKKNLLPNIRGNSQYFLNDPKYYELKGEPVPEYATNNAESKLAIEIYGPIISFIGTLIWGYGDLLKTVFF